MFLKTLFLSIAVLTATFSAARAQTTATADSSALIVGKWAGTYEGSDSGKFELIINQDSNRKLTGQIVMLPPDGNRYPINLKTVVWQNGQLNAAYTDPESGGDVSFSGKPNGANLKGTWEAGGGQSTGNWQVARADK